MLISIDKLITCICVIVVLLILSYWLGARLHYLIGRFLGR